ncbi:GIY-YIG nuclease family protein [Fusobacterium sp. MFO224]|uniref:GIY-YIG nuclease family protein n=1 Tax=Fusobacterium sp. MFO224 TaxID=3378070 RepID=UPI00385382DF
MGNWYIYILRCKDDSLYTGITNNIQKRYEKHKSGNGAKYTKIKGVKKMEIIFLSKNRSEASKIEYILKKKTKKNKEILITEEKERIEFIKNIEKKYKMQIVECVEK